MRLLIAEDDPLLPLMWADVFAEAGANVLGPCASTAHALRLIGAERPELALLDIELRDGDSFPVARALQALGVPFAFLSGRDREDLAPEFSGTPYLRKPVTARDVFATLLAFRNRD